MFGVYSMKVVVLNIWSLIRHLALILLVILAISLVSLTGMEALGVFTPHKEIPIYSVECEGKKAAITFDCAWGADDIPRILETLRDENVKATFFLVGRWAEKNPEAVRRIAAEGHDVANHSYSHFRMGSLDLSQIRNEISICTVKLAEISGKRSDLFRPPYGDYNNQVVAAAREMGLYTIQWSVDSLDWKPGISQAEIKCRIQSKVKPGSIILFHNDTPHTANMLPDVIHSLKSRGYELVPVSQLILRKDFIIDHEGRQIKKDNS